MHALPTPRLNVLVIHAEPLLAVGLCAALRQQADFDVHADGPEREPDHPVDVVVTDYATALRLAGQARGPQAERTLAGARIMLVTTSDREHEVRLALERGVHGYLLLGCPIEELAAGVRTLGQGSRYLCMAVAQRMAESLTREALTAREAEVLRLVALGQCNKAIARELAIAVGTVKAHVKAIMGKLDASCRTQAASIASQRGLVDAAPGAEPSRPRHPMPLRAVPAAGNRLQYA